MIWIHLLLLHIGILLHLLIWICLLLTLILLRLLNLTKNSICKLLLGVYKSFLLFSLLLNLLCLLRQFLCLLRRHFDSFLCLLCLHLCSLSLGV